MSDVHEDRAHVTATLFAVQGAFEDLVLRGLESTGPEDVQRLDTMAEELGRVGAGYVAGVIGDLVRRVRESDDGAPRALLRAQTAMRVFERVLSLDAAAEVFGAGERVEDDAPEPARSTATDAAAISPVLEELARFVEGLVGSGLTTASAATKQKIDASFKEASRLKLLRLAASLRYVGDECGRFLADSAQFSARRFAFFLNRTWLISRGLQNAIANDDKGALARLLLQSAPQPVTTVTVVVVGVHKRALLDGSAAFEFRMRVVRGDVPPGTRLVWSCVFGARPGVPAEAFLHLPQAQKFAPKLLLEPTEVAITNAAVALDEHGGGRVMLGPKSLVTAGAKVKSWETWSTWDPVGAADRIARHRISPLDLEVELQEEVVVTDWQLGEPAPNPYRDEQQVYPLTNRDGRTYDAIASSGPDGEELVRALDGFRKKTAKRPPLFGLVHYEMARLVFQPLAVIEDAGPRHLMISRDKIDLASLMKTLDFRT